MHGARRVAGTRHPHASPLWLAPRCLRRGWFPLSLASPLTDSAGALARLQPASTGPGRHLQGPPTSPSDTGPQGRDLCARVAPVPQGTPGQSGGVCGWLWGVGQSRLQPEFPHSWGEQRAEQPPPGAGVHPGPRHSKRTANTQDISLYKRNSAGRKKTPRDTPTCPRGDGRGRLSPRAARPPPGHPAGRPAVRARVLRGEARPREQRPGPTWPARPMRMSGHSTTYTRSPGDATDGHRERPGAPAAPVGVTKMPATPRREAVASAGLPTPTSSGAWLRFLSEPPK